MEIRVRPMKLEDLGQVHAIDVLSFSMPWSERSFRFELTGNKASRLWVAEVPGPDGQAVIAGMIAIWMIIDEAHIGTIATHPDYRRQGIGRKLLAAALLSVAGEGARQAFLEVRKSNHSAQALYRQFGFEVTGVRPRYYRDNNEDALLLTLSELRPEELRRLAQEEPGSEEPAAGTAES